MKSFSAQIPDGYKLSDAAQQRLDALAKASNRHARRAIEAVYRAQDKRTSFVTFIKA